jgi:PAS domain S-box-containing protein
MRRLTRTMLGSFADDELDARIKQVLETGKSLSYRAAVRNEDVRRWWRIRLVPVKTGESITSVLGCAREETRQRFATPILRKEDKIHQRLVEYLPDAVIFTDQKGSILYVNASGVRLLGAATPDEVLGVAVWDMIPPEDLGRVIERGRLLRQGQRVDLVEHKLVRMDGTVVPIETLSVPLRYGGRQAILTTARDISERKHLEQALTKSQDLFFKAFQVGPVAYTISREADGVLVEVNDEYVKLTGYGRDELIGTAAADLPLWMDPRQLEQLRADAMKKGSVFGSELSVRRKDGEVRKLITSVQRVEVRNEPCLLSVGVDVTERDRFAEAERESRDLFYRIFHASPAAMATIRLSDGRFLDVNEHWSVLTEYDADTTAGMTISEIDLWDQAQERSAFQPSLQETLYDSEMTLRTRNGKDKTVIASFQQIQVKGEPCLLMVMTDISERKAMELELLRSKEHAEEMSRIKTAFLTNMTHEVRTPLTVILGFTSMLRQGVREEYQRFIKVIERSGRRLLLMLDSILDLAQLESGSLNVERQLFNVTDVVRSESDSFRPIVEEKGLRFNLRLPSERAYVRADHKIFVRILNNIFDNAVKFTERGSITLSVEVDSHRVHTVVEDTGIGIDPAFLPHVFDEFAQESTGLERTHQGSGLGLTVSRRLMELIGGTIDVESRKEKGSRFVLSLPRANGSEL